MYSSKPWEHCLCIPVNHEELFVGNIRSCAARDTPPRRWAGTAVRPGHYIWEWPAVPVGRVPLRGGATDVQCVMAAACANHVVRRAQGMMGIKWSSGR